jgi:exonuclease SbcD
VAELVGRAEEFGEDYLRVYVREATRAGLREEIQEALPNALEIRIDPEFAAPVTTAGGDRAIADRSPGELFASYCEERTVEDKRVKSLFARLHDEETSGV